MFRRTLLGVFGLAALSACAPRPLPPPPNAPRIVAAAELIPPDLDVVARLDMTRIKAALGSITPEALAREVLARSAGANGDEPDELLVTSILSADVVYLGYRPNDALMPLDRVLALQGRFEPLGRSLSGFVGPTDLGADLRYWDRRAQPSLPRSSVARVYALGERVRAFVSEAELDAVERTLDGLGSPRRLVPAEEGSLSLAARPQRLGRLAGLVGSTLRDVLEQSTLLELVIDLESDAAKLKLELTTADATHAAELARAAQLVLARALGARGSRVAVRQDRERLIVSYGSSRAELALLVACLRRGSGSASDCPW
jgi:hypothetical protein